MYEMCVPNGWTNAKNSEKRTWSLEEQNGNWVKKLRQEMLGGKFNLVDLLLLFAMVLRA